MKGFLNKVRRQSDNEGASSAGVDAAPKADVSIPVKKERK